VRNICRPSILIRRSPAFQSSLREMVVVREEPAIHDLHGECLTAESFPEISVYG
jgi:hypothetical protein